MTQLKEKTMKFCDRTIEFCLFGFIFFLPFAKAALTTFTWLAIAAWLVKKTLSLQYESGGFEKKSTVTTLDKAIFAFVIANALSVLASVDFGFSLKAFFAKLTKFILFYFVVSEAINTKRRLRNIIFVMFLSAILIVSDACVQYITGKDFLRSYRMVELSASFLSANGFAGWLLIYIFVFLGIINSKTFILPNKKVMNLGLSLLILLLAICLILTKSRAAFLGFWVALVLFVYWYSRFWKRWKARLFYFSIAVCLIAVFLIFPHSFSEGMKSLFSLKRGSSSLERITLWRQSLTIVEDFPLFGSGLNTYTNVIKKYLAFEGGGMYPHNSFLHMAAELGMIGLTAFILLLVSLFQLVFRELKKKHDALILSVSCGILGFLVLSFFDTHLYALQSVSLFWFMIGFTVSLTRLEMNPQEEFHQS
ncbi:MAG: hypothetical protein AMJ95_00970 [Omnitrophica WOR_2 bacterium SM23_72]|nr:MAG: hypothetical protein AMJ95_00970 [Omnitrophica WOR_2 bacterium SM23_72]